jgi:Protein of unknown function (DUF2817)
MFALRYSQARNEFLDAAHTVGAKLHHDIHPLKGRDGEEMALDIAVLGDPSAPKRLLLTSGCHGVEGFCGSGIQIAALNDRALLRNIAATDIAIVFAHGLNPYGFSFIRRATEENVDLNRNFLDFNQPLPINPNYAEFHELLIPEVWPPSAEQQARLNDILAKKGLRYAQAAIAGGQYTHPDGLHYGGATPTWAHLATVRLLSNFCSSANHLGWIDFHTGLGAPGHGERIYSPCAKSENSDAVRANFDRANRWWSGAGKTPLTQVKDGTSASTELMGTMNMVGLRTCPNTELTKITLEFGTQEPLKILDAMRGEQWLQLHSRASAEQHAQLKQTMMDAFFVNSQLWQNQVLAQGLEAIEQGVNGLAQIGS